MSVLVLDRVTRRYGEVTALRDVTLRIEEGEDVAIVGPSGSGKSTLLHMMGTLDRPTSGRVQIAGQDPAALRDAALSRLRGAFLGFVFQQAHLVPGLTAQENVLLGLQYAGAPRAARKDRAREALDRVGLSHRVDHRPGALSGGERQRVGIARALVNRPALVLADEPTGALDQATGRGILDLFRRLHAEGTTIAMITHDPAVASAFSRRVTIRDGALVDGALVEGGAA